MLLMYYMNESGDKVYTLQVIYTINLNVLVMWKDTNNRGHDDSSVSHALLRKSEQVYHV